MDNNKLLLLHKDEFIPKNINTRTGKCEFKGIELKSLTVLAGPDLDKDGLVCPVKCVKVYIKRTKVRRGALKSLFNT